MKHSLMVAVVIISLALPVAASAQNAPLTARLNYSHACTVPDGNTELHFVLVQSPDVSYVGTAVLYTVSLDGGPALSGIAPYFSRTGGTVHYVAYVAPATVADVTSATLTVGGVTYELANPGPETTYACNPLSVVITDFAATCAPGIGVRLDWTVSTQASVTRYLIARNGEPILEVLSECPGCTNSATYSRTIALPDAHGIYTLLAYSGDALIDLEEAWLASCSVPTAVRLSSFGATSRRWWQ